MEISTPLSVSFVINIKSQEGVIPELNVCSDIWQRLLP